MSKNIQPELIKILKTNIGAESVNSVNSREIWEYVESKQEFSTWVKKRLEELGAIKNEDYLTIDRKINRQILKEYIVTLDIAKHLAMMERNAKGKEARDYFIMKEKEANKPKTVIELLEESVLEIKRLGKESLTLTNIIENQKPKVLFADSVSQSYTSILIGQFAKAISTDSFKIGQNKMFDWLRSNGYLCNGGTRHNQPKQQYIDNGYFEVIERTIINSDGSTRITITTKIKGKGQVSLTKKIYESFNL